MKTKIQIEEWPLSTIKDVALALGAEIENIAINKSFFKKEGKHFPDFIGEEGLMYFPNQKDLKWFQEHVKAVRELEAEVFKSEKQEIIYVCCTPYDVSLSVLDKDKAIRYIRENITI